MAPKRTKQIEPTPLGRKITQYRKKQGLTMQQLAAELGVTASYVSFLESGERSPSRKLIKKMVLQFYPQGNPHLLDEWLILAGFSPEHPQPVIKSNDPHQAFQARLSQDQGDIRTQFAYIRSLIKSQEFERARQQIQACFQIFDGTVEVQSLAGSLELAKGNYEHAITAQQTALDYFRQGRQSPPPKIGLTDLLLSLGVSWFLKGYGHLGEYHTAESLMQKKIAQSARQAALYSFESSQKIFAQALEADPEDIYIWDEYARVSFNLAHLATPEQAEALWQETIRGYQQVLRHRDNRVMGSEALLETAVFMGHAHSKSQNFDKAEDILSLIQAIRPEHALAHYARACLHSLRAQAESNEADLDAGLDHLACALQLDSSGKNREESRVDPDLATLRAKRSKAFARLTANQPVSEKEAE